MAEQASLELYNMDEKKLSIMVFDNIKHHDCLFNTRSILDYRHEQRYMCAQHTETNLRGVQKAMNTPHHEQIPYTVVNAEIKIHESAEKVIAYSFDKRSFMR